VSDAGKQQSPTASDQNAEWKVFDDEVYRFQVKYPPDWVIHEAQINNTATDVPIRRVLEFSPQDWEGRMATVAIEVGVGGLEEMRMWPVTDAEQTQTEEINGNQVIVGEGMYEEVFYVFAHPTNSNIWVTLRDNTGGRGDSSVKEVIEAMLSYLMFTE
jgi:hypothetical protein